MQKKNYFFLWLLYIFIGTTMQAQTNMLDPTKGVLRIKIQEEVVSQLGTQPVPMSNGVVATGIQPFDRANREVKAVRMERVFPYVERMEAKARKHGLHLWYEVRFDESIAPEQAMKIYQNVPGVMIAEKVVPMQLIEGNTGFIRLTDEQKERLNTRSLSAPFNDPFLNQQWHYQNDGSMTGSIAGSDINLFNAWQVATGNRELLVAIIDGGIDYEHVDLADNVYINEAELNGLPGVDDDKNGFIDDIYGFNFVTNTGEIYPHDHGTHVAGTVGAVNNNGIGVAGVAGGNGQGGVKMLSCQVFDSRSSTREADFAKPFYYAAVQGASIAQCSWGWSTSGYYEQAVVDAIRFFTEEADSPFMKGGLAIFANGNTGTEGDFYPACLEDVVAVGSMTYDKKAASYSSYGDWVDITAPGGYMTYNSAEGVLSTLPGNQYGFSEGTSMACPHVSGIAALVLSKYGNPTFPNETLRQQLLTSVNDFYSTNPTVEGKFGSGYIDAYKAMQMGSGNAPQVVGDFTMMPGQDNVILEWAIPESDDRQVNYHIIYHHTAPFTGQDNLGPLSQKRFDTRFYTSGDVVTYELTDLLPTTTYYIAIQAVDRWGNAAGISEVKSMTTNAGPKMELDQSSLYLSLNASTSPIATGSFTIKNVDEGLLRWESFARTVSMYPMSTFRPNPGPMVTYGGDMTIIQHAATDLITADYSKDDYPQELAYHYRVGAYIGESDLSLTNSMAQWYYIHPDSFPNGFNLTDLLYVGYNGQNPVIEIYDGSTAISSSKLIQKVEYNYFYYNFDVTLKEQLYFAPGESFWLVTHFDKGYDSPLGAGTLTNEAYKAYSFYSSDWGSTWSQLSEVLRESNLSDIADELGWGITLKSKNPDWSEVLTLSPSKGDVRAFEEQKVDVSTDGQVLVNGSYSFNLKLTTNESDNREKSLPVSLSVTGYMPELVTPQMVDFGDLLIGQSRTLTVEVINSGYGIFNMPFSPAVTCTSDQYQMPSYTQSFAARAKSSFDLTFKPTVAGSHTGTVTITSREGYTHTFVVRGIAEEPAKIELSETVFNIGDLEVGAEAKDVKFTITNQGKFPLQYVFPKFSTETIDSENSHVHKYGYSYFTNFNGSTEFVYDGNPELYNSTDITAVFNDQNKWSDPVNVGFAFPYYGEVYEQLYISSFGAMSVSTEGAIQVCQIPGPTYQCAGDLGLIAAYCIGELKTNENSKIEYARQDGKFVLKYSNVLAITSSQSYVPISFRIILSANGDIEFFYDDYTPSLVSTQGTGIYVGLTDLKVQDPITITDYYNYQEQGMYQNFKTGAAVKFQAPNSSIIQSLSSTYGVIPNGESKEIVAKVAAIQGMYAGPISNTLMIVSNDPVNSGVAITLNANITGESLTPIATLENDVIDFGTVYKTATVVAPLTIKNAGTDKLEVKSIVVENAKFTLDQEVPFIILPGSSKDVMITLPTVNEGAVEDAVNVVIDENTQLTATLKGHVIGAPAMQLNLETISETIASGDVLEKQIVAQNVGNEALDFSITPSDYFKVADLTADAASSISYVYKTSLDDTDIVYNWEDVETTGEGTQIRYTHFVSYDYYELELPYEITFFGKNYSKFYIYNTGFISFNHYEDLKETPMPPQTLPTTNTFYTNIIAPYWGVHTMDTGAGCGVFYAFKDDRIIVSFMGYGSTLNHGVCFQAIIYRNGNIKYQYKLMDSTSQFLAHFGVCGVQNDGGTEGACLPSRATKMGEAAMFYPVKSYKVAPNEAKSIDLVLDTDLMANNYQYGVELNTNIPTAAKVTIPVELNITGEAQPVHPFDLTFESVVGVYTVPYILNIDFDIANTGTAAYKITNISAPDLIGYSATSIGTLQYYGLFRDWMGRETYQYGAYAPGTTITVAKEPVNFRIAFSKYNVVGEYTVPLVFTVEGLDKETLEIPFKLSITPAPAIQFGESETRIKGIANDYVGEVEVALGNIGEYKLSYSVSVDPSGVGEEAETAAYALRAAKMQMKIASLERAGEMEQLLSTVEAVNAFEASTRQTNLDLPSNIDYRNALYYPMIPGVTRMYLIGAGNKTSDFKGAIQFTAPADGFNLSSLYFYATIGDMKNVDIKAEIIQGEDPLNGDVIGKGMLHVAKELPTGYDSNGEPVYNGCFKTMTLDKPIYINPNESFYVIFTFPAGYESSMAIAPREEAVVAGRYLHWLEGFGWYDTGITYDSTLGSLGYFATCLEMEEGSPWIRILNAETAGAIEPNDVAAIKLGVNAAAARLEKDNKAVLVVKSNDPQRPVVNYPIYMDLNGAPVVSTPTGLIYVKEAEVSTITLEAADADGDSFTLTIQDENGFATLSAAVAKEGSDVAIEKVDEKSILVTSNVKDQTSAVRVEVSLSPDYGDAGSHWFEIHAVDAAGNSALETVRYYVEHVNRAPVALEQEDIEIALQSTSFIVDFASLFQDPDGDELAYAISLSEEGVVDMFSSEDRVIFVGKKLGDVTVTVTATDKERAVATNTFQVKVVAGTGLQGSMLDEAVAIYPNPVVDVLNISVKAEGEIAYRLYDTDGKMIYSETANQYMGQTHTIDMGSCSSGIYFLELEMEDQKTTVSIIKK